MGESWGFGMPLVVVCLVSAASVLIVARMTRGITIYGADNLYQIRAAARAGEWRWPSDMHRHGEGKTRMKDGVILALALMQRLLGDRTGAYPLVMLCLVANAVSAVLVFLIASTYWTTGVGLLLFGLTVGSVWPYLLVLYGAHILTAQAFFLAAVYLMPQADSAPLPQVLAWYGASGAAIGLLLFSSASSRKYLPLLAGAFLQSQSPNLVPGWLPENGWVASGSLMVGALVVALCLGLAAWHLRHRRLLRALSFGSILHLALSLALSRSPSFYAAQLSLALGIGAVVLLLTLPDVKANLLGYLAYWNAGKYFGHFRLYREFFARAGRPIPNDMRGAGLRWIWRYFWRIAPFHSAYSLFCLAVGILILEGFPPGEAAGTLGVLALSLSPVVVGEVTRGLQLGRTYFPAFAGLLLLMGYTAFRADQLLTGPAVWVFWGLSLACLMTSTGWNLWVFMDDVWPTRMAPVWLDLALRARGIKTFYTYDIPYTHALFYVMWQECRARYDVRFIKRLEEVKEGYVVVPGTSAKAVNMECHPYAMDHGDFDEDPVLNRLLASGEIARYAVASFKTLGTSRMWGHESEVVSYRDLILKDVDEYDRWRARAWILDAEKLHTEGWFAHASGEPLARSQSVNR